MRLAWERRWNQPSRGNPLWESVHWADHAASEYAHTILDERAVGEGDDFEALIRGMARGHDERYDPVLARLRAQEASGLDPFAEANRR